MPFFIRSMQATDAAAVNELSMQLGYALKIEETAMQLEDVLRSTGHIALVAVENDTVIGWIHAFKTLYLESLPFVEIGGLVVDEHHRGKGVGKALIENVTKWCRREGVLRLRLRSQHKRIEAHRFYEALGFKVIKEQKVFELLLES